MRMAEEGPGQDPFDEDPRLDRLNDRLSEIEAKQGGTAPQGRSVDDNYRLGNRVLADLIGGIAGGLLFGWLFDRWFGTSPWLLIVFLFLGIIVAFRNIIRVSNAHAARVSEKTDQPDGAHED